MSDDSGLTAPIAPAPLQESTPVASQRRIHWTPRLVIWTVLLAAALIFVLQNFDEVRINVLFWDFRPPLALIVGICFLVGYALGWLRPLFRSNRRS